MNEQSNSRWAASVLRTDTDTVARNSQSVGKDGGELDECELRLVKGKSEGERMKGGEMKK